jgi:uncharacterized membrane protein YeaQ/YmgE (transglycosylase-associated protein family)
MEVKSYVKAFVAGIVGIVVAVNLVPPLLNATNSVSGDVPILASSIVGTVVGAGILLVILEIFI